MRNINEIKEGLAGALTSHRGLDERASDAERRAATIAVQAHRRELMAAIVDGATPCPYCGQPPIGLEQQRAHGKRVIVEYEIGCSQLCGRKARGGPMPRHAVEAWNEGMYL